MAAVTELVADPAWFPLAFDRAARTIRFGRIDRTALAAHAFLDARMAGAVSGVADARLDAVAAAFAGLARPRAAFIFHTSFCCSTLLARALDAPGAALALKEPNILLDIANAARVDAALARDGAGFARLAALVVGLLARGTAGERVIIKPTNAANTLAAAALAGGAHALFLYGPLRDYLVSILKKGEEGRAFVRQQFNIFALDGEGLAAIAPRQAMGFTDLQCAAIVWRHQIEAFAATLAPADGRRVASLDYRKLLDAPEATLTAAARHLDLPLTEEMTRAAASGTVFASDAKFTDRAFDSRDRETGEREIEARWASELDLIEGWAQSLNLGVDAALPLPRGLDP